MASRSNVSLLAFNRGVVSPLALARIDIERMALSAEIQTNWMPRSLGPMMLRPGWQYLLSSLNNAPAIYVPFVFSSTDTALLEVSSGAVRVLISDVVVSRNAVSTTISNGTFTSDLTGWTDADESGASSVWETGGFMSLTGTASTAAIRRQTLAISASDQNQEHGVILVVARGSLTLKVGTTSGGDELLLADGLGEGTHYLTFTPTTGSAYVELSSYTKYETLLNSITISAGGALVMGGPWGGSDLQRIRWSQSGDVVYVACAGIHPYKIERRSTNAWSIVKYLPADGPFRNTNPTAITLTPSALSGSINVTASAALFKPGHVGALFSLDSVGQRVEEDIAAEATFTSEIRITGVGATRAFVVNISGTWSATVTLQRSVGEPGAWVDVATYASNTSASVNDELDNQIIYYRIGVKAGGYTSGTVDASLSYSGGSLTGIFRIISVASPTAAAAIVLRDLGGTSANDVWSEGSWSGQRGWPSAVTLYEGRLWWAGKGSIYGSISDAYESFDDEEEGDSGPLNRSIGYGPVDNINWLLPVNRLIIGTDGAEVSARSTSFDEPLTPTNFNLKNASTQGSAAAPAAVIDTKGIFVQKSGSRVYELAYQSQDFDYGSSELTVLCPEIGEPSITRVAVQRQPDTRVHCVRSDGKVALLVFDRAENVICWVLVETSGFVEDVVVLPGTIEDAVYYLVRRTISGQTRRYLEKWAKESECQGALLNKQADSFVVYDGAAASSVSVAHLEGQPVVIWADGEPIDAQTVSGGAITLATPASKVVVGLGYTARYKSAKLAYGAQAGTALAQTKRIDKLALILYNTRLGGLRYGCDFDHMDNIPREVAGEILDEDTILASYDAKAFPLNGTYDTDSRLCLEVDAPNPATILAGVMSLEVNEKV